MNKPRPPARQLALPRSAAWCWLAAALAVGVFVLDLSLLGGQGEAALYVIVVLVFLWSSHWRYVLAVAAACSLLTLIGSYFSIGVTPPSATAINYIFSLLSVWFTAILGRRMKQLAEDLAAAELRTRTIVESAAEGILTMDQRGMIETCNPAAAAMFQYASEEIVGRNASTLVPAEAREAYWREFADLFDNRGMDVIRGSREIKGRRRDGTTFPLWVAASNVGVGHERIVVWVAMDLTELESAEARAVQAERLAAIGEAMTGLTHESRNALQRSQAACEMLAREISGQTEALDLLARIQTAQFDLHQIYEEVRGYAAPVTLKTAPCRLDDVIGQAWEKVQEARPDRDARCDVAKAPFDVTCNLDVFIMRRVFRNIIDNSLDAAEDPVRITVSFAEATINGRAAVQATLRDNGPGLGDEHREKLFEPFYTTKASGTGLGMPLARRYVEAHGGVIDLPNDHGNGAVIRVTLPRAEA